MGKMNQIRKETSPAHIKENPALAIKSLPNKMPYTSRKSPSGGPKSAGIPSKHINRAYAAGSGHLAAEHSHRVTN
jgi:hypothetical protein